MSLQWYALQSKPREEDAALRQVTSKGVEAYYPCVRVRTVNPRARQVRPFFPGYLFVRLEAGDVGAHTFRWVPHLIGLVCCGDEPSAVPDALITSIQRHVSAFAAIAFDPCQGLQHGDRVRIKDSPFEGYEAMFDTRLSGADRVRVLLELLNGQSITLHLRADQIEPVRRASGVCI